MAGQAGEDGGRHLVAREDIPAGQLLIREDPVFMGPRKGAGRVCVGCCMGGILDNCQRWVSAINLDL